MAALGREVTPRALAHVTGGGLAANLARVLPGDVDAVIDESSWEPPRIFDEIARLGAVEPAEMRRVFNMGIGMVAVVAPEDVHPTLHALDSYGHEAVEIGRIVPGRGSTHVEPRTG